GDLADRSALYHSAEIPDDDLVGDVGDLSQVRGDEEDGHIQLGLQAGEESQDLRLRGDVQGGGGLVGDEQLGPTYQGHRDHRALTHPARELECVGVEAFLGLRHPHLVQRLDDELPRALAVEIGVDLDRLHDLVPDGMHRREGGHRLLEDHGDLVPPDPTDLGPLRVQDGQIHSAHVGVSTPEHPPAGDLPRLIDDLEDGATGDALPAAALPDDTDRLPTRDLEADAVDRTHGAMIGLELSAQVLDLQERALDLRHGAPRQSSAR